VRSAVARTLANFNARIRACHQGSGRNDPHIIYEELLSSGLRPDPDTYLHLAKCYIMRRGEPDTLKWLIREMHQHLDKPPKTYVVIWNTLMASFLQHPNLSREFLKKINHYPIEEKCSLARSLWLIDACERSAATPPDSYTYNNLLNELVVSDGYAALTFFQIWMERLAFSRKTIEDVIILFRPLDSKTSREQRAVNEPTPPYPTSHTMNILLRLLPDVDRASALIDWFAKFFRIEMVSPTLNTVLVTMSTRGDPLEAISGFFNKHATVANILSYNLILDACVKRGEITEIFDYFERLLLARLSPTVITYTVLMRATKDAGDSAGVFELLGVMDLEGIKVNASTIKVLLQTCDNLERDSLRAWSIFQQHYFKLKNSITHEDECSLFRALIQACTHSPTIDLALEAFTLFKTSVHKASNEDLSGMYECLLNVCEQKGDIIRIHEVQQEMKSLGLYRSHGTTCYYHLPIGKKVVSKSNRYSPVDAKRTQEFVEYIKKNSSYVEAPEALPLKALHDLSSEQACASLHLHAEKQAVAKLWYDSWFLKTDQRRPPVLFLDVVMCADCQSFITNAAVVLGKELTFDIQGRIRVFKP